MEPSTKILEIYTKWYDMSLHALEEYRVSYEFTLKEGVKGIAISGMGGSGIVGDVIYFMLYDRVDIPVAVIKDFNVPTWIRKDWLLIAISYSGNTLETIHTVINATRRGVRVVVITSNGELMRYAMSRNIPYVKVDEGYVPRAAFPLLLIAALKILKSLGLIGDVRLDLEALKTSADDLASSIASFIGSDIPVFIVSHRYYPLGLRAKNEFNENAKLLSKVEVLPEWGHNDIVGWESNYVGIKAVVFNDDSELMKYIAPHLRSYGHEVMELHISKNKSYLYNTLYWFKVLGMASVINALRRGLVPEETKSISKYKEYLRKTRLARISF